MPPPWSSESGGTCGRATGRGAWTKTYIKARGAWTYLYQAVDSLGRTIDFRFSPRWDTTAAKRFFRKALSQPHVVNPRTITADKNPSYPRAVRQLKRAGTLWRFSPLWQRKYLNNIAEPGAAQGWDGDLVSGRAGGRWP